MGDLADFAWQVHNHGWYSVAQYGHPAYFRLFLPLACFVPGW